jgi:hypothetical protein
VRCRRIAGNAYCPRRAAFGVRSRRNANVASPVAARRWICRVREDDDDPHRVTQWRKPATLAARLGTGATKLL